MAHHKVTQSSQIIVNMNIHNIQQFEGEMFLEFHIFLKRVYDAVDTLTCRAGRFSPDQPGNACCAAFRSVSGSPEYSNEIKSLFLH